MEIFEDMDLCRMGRHTQESRLSSLAPRMKLFVPSPTRAPTNLKKRLQDWISLVDSGMCGGDQEEIAT